MKVEACAWQGCSLWVIPFHEKFLSICRRSEVLDGIISILLNIIKYYDNVTPT